MPYATIRVESLKRTLRQIESHIYTPIASLKVSAYVTKEPVHFEARRSSQQIDLEIGEKWGELWDCAWFHFTGQVPRSAAGCKVVLLLDVNGELCLFDEEGTPTQGLTNVNSEFDFSLGLPGKRVVQLTAAASGEEIIDVWADAGNNDLFGHYRSGTVKEASVAICHEETRQLYYDFEVLLDLAEHLGDQSARRKQVWQALYEVHLLLRAMMSEEVIAQARELLAPLLAKRGGDPTLKVSAIGHAHIDLAWLWPIRETYRKGARTFSTALRMMEQYPDYVFGASQPQLYEWVKDQHPKLYEQIKQRVKEGRWEVQGAMWVEPDSNLSGGEALVRQILYGKRFFQKEFGLDMKILWVPDIFGYTACLPQLLRKSGVDYVMTQKLSWNVHNDHPHHTFLWEGMDGSQVLTHLPPEDTYNGPAAPRSILKAEREYLDNNVSEHCLVLFGIGDGGGGPGEEHLERLARERNLQGLIPVEQEPALNFFENLNGNRERYKTWKGELYLEKHQGTFTSQARNKRFNRKMEKALRELEFVSSLALTGGGDYPSTELETIWKEVLLYQFHDILPGSSIKRVYDESLARYELLLARVEALTEQACQSLVPTSSILAAKKQSMVLNSLPWERREWMQVGGNWIHVTVPAMGYCLVEEAYEPAEADEHNALQEQDVLENDLIRLEFDQDGSIRSIFDKQLGREVLAEGQSANILSIYADDGDAWDFPEDYRNTNASTMKLVQSKAYTDGPRVLIEQQFQYGESTLTQTIILTAGSKRVDFETEVDWKEDGRMLRTAFPVHVYTEQVNCDVQFGHLKRNTHQNTMWDYAKDEICAHQWIDLSQPDFGVALLNDCKYGYSVNGNVMDIHLLRSPSHPDPTCDRAHHKFVYALLPHEGDFIRADVYKQGYELNIPLLNVALSGISDSSSSTLWPALQSAFELEHSGVMIEAVKKAEDEHAILVRLYETSGANSEVGLTVNLPHMSAVHADLMENPLAPLAGNSGCYQLNFTPFEIKTVLIRLSDK
jgi:alpha-mannosidase